MRWFDSAGGTLTAGLVLGALLRLLVSQVRIRSGTAQYWSPVSSLDPHNLDLDLDDLEPHAGIPGVPATGYDGHAHNDNDSESKKMAGEVRVLCWVMTSPKTLYAKAIHVRDTWAKRCNKFLFMSDVDDVDFPAVGVDTDAGREHLTAKTMRAFDYIYENHFDDADWFMKADDDTFVVVENLRYMLSAHQPTEPVFFGHHFGVIVKQGYFSGGAGYVLSKEALRRFSKRTDEDNCQKDSGAEDVALGQCMEKLGVRTGDSRDKLDRSRFHCFNPGTHVIGGYPSWYLKYDKYGANKGIDAVSDYPVSYHYMSPSSIHLLEYSLYHMDTHGIVHGTQQLNPDTTTITSSA